MPTSGQRRTTPVDGWAHIHATSDNTRLIFARRLTIGRECFTSIGDIHIWVGGKYMVVILEVSKRYQGLKNSTDTEHQHQEGIADLGYNR